MFVCNSYGNQVLGSIAAAGQGAAQTLTIGSFGTARCDAIPILLSTVNCQLSLSPILLNCHTEYRVHFGSFGTASTASFAAPSFGPPPPPVSTAPTLQAKSGAAGHSRSGGLLLLASHRDELLLR